MVSRNYGRYRFDCIYSDTSKNMEIPRKRNTNFVFIKCSASRISAPLDRFVQPRHHDSFNCDDSDEYVDGNFYCSEEEIKKASRVLVGTP